jgi:hypothetical protein
LLPANIGILAHGLKFRVFRFARIVVSKVSPPARRR